MIIIFCITLMFIMNYFILLHYILFIIFCIILNLILNYLHFYLIYLYILW